MDYTVPIWQQANITRYALDTKLDVLRAHCKARHYNWNCLLYLNRKRVSLWTLWAKWFHLTWLRMKIMMLSAGDISEDFLEFAIIGHIGWAFNIHNCYYRNAGNSQVFKDSTIKWKWRYANPSAYVKHIQSHRERLNLALGSAVVPCLLNLGNQLQQKSINNVRLSNALGDLISLWTRSRSSRGDAGGSVVKSLHGRRFRWWEISRILNSKNDASLLILGSSRKWMYDEVSVYKDNLLITTQRPLFGVSLIRWKEMYMHSPPRYELQWPDRIDHDETRRERELYSSSEQE